MKDIKKERGILFWGRRGKKEKKFFFSSFFCLTVGLFFVELFFCLTG
jgi:hypothetical protein